MLTPYPPCPSCGENDLWRVAGPQVMFRCADCGWSSGLLGMASLPDNGRELLERAVQEAKAVQAQRGAS